MTQASSWLFRGGQAHGLAGYGIIPGADIPTYLAEKYMPKSWAWSKGMGSVARAVPYAQGASAAYLAYKYRTPLAAAGQRIAQGMTGGRYQAPPSAWENTPQMAFRNRLPRRIGYNAPMSPMPAPYLSGGVVYMP